MPYGRVEREVERERDLLDRLDPVGAALDEVVGAVDLDVVERGLEHVCRHQARLLPDLAGRLDRRGHADRRRAAAVRAVAERRPLRVRVLDDDVVHRDAELVADHLGVGRLVALALRLGAHREHDLAGQVDLEVGRLPHRRAPALADRADPLAGRDAAHLDVGRQADAEVLAAACERPPWPRPCRRSRPSRGPCRAPARSCPSRCRSWPRPRRSPGRTGSRTGTCRAR